MTIILIIDDEPQVRVVLRMIFELEGYTVIEASDGHQGLKLYNENKVDLIITDLFMPEKEGLETINEFKKAFPEIKIIAMSGGSHLRSAKLLGAVATFEKPVRKDILLKTIREFI